MSRSLSLPIPAALVCASLGLAAAGASGQSKVLDPSPLTLTNMQMSGLSPNQTVRPLASQRGVNLDGALRHPGTFGATFWANPFGEGWDGQQRLGDIRIDTGTYSPTEVDLALPCIGPAWVIGRTYNSVQRNSTDTGYWNSTSFQGSNWFQSSQPELIYSVGNTASDDTLYLVYGADRYIEFVRTGEASEYFKAKNGAAGIIKHEAYFGSETPTPPGTYTYYDQVGNQVVFFDSDYDGYQTTGQIWKITDANSKVAYVGDPSSITGAITSGYDPSYAAILKAYDSADRRFSYTYTSGKLTRVVAETKSSGTWASPSGVSEVGRVDYDYFASTVTDQGTIGDLKLVTLTTPLSSGSLVRRQYYRYYTGTYNSSTNPGSPHQIKMVLGYEGTRNYDWQDNAALDTSYDSTGVSASTLKPYSSIYLEYNDTSTSSENGKKRIKSVQFNGECGCSGGGASGTYGLSYEANGGFSNTSGYDQDWKSRVTITRPDSTCELRYFDEVGQPLSRAILSAAPGSSPLSWANKVVRSADGCVTDIATPEASLYTDSTRAITESGSSGLVNVIERCDSTLADFSGKSDLDGLPVGQQYRLAGATTKYYTSSIDPDSFSLTLSGAIKVIRPLAGGMSVYPSATTSRTDSSRNHTVLTNTAHSSGLALKQVDTTLPAVSTGNGGSGSANTRSDYFGLDGRMSFSQNEEGIIAYRGYDAVTGLLTVSIQDADTSSSDLTGITIPTGFSSSGSPLHYKTTYAYDPQGRMTLSTAPDGCASPVYYTALADGRSVTVSSPKTTGSVWYGPGSFIIANHAGKPEAQGTIAFSGNTTSTNISSWISTSATNPVGAVSTGSIARLSRSSYDNAGAKLLESDVYYLIPSSSGSWPGSSSANYDPTVFGYDSMGRRWRSKTPAGDITRLVYDALGRTTERWAGTNDSSLAGGEASGTDTMTELEVMVYDGGSAGGNSHLTSRTADEDGNWTTTTDQRSTSYAYDYRGRLILTSPPIAPYTVAKYDNLGRTVASGQYDASGGLSVSTDPTSTASTGSTKRTALSEMVYDEMGRAFKAIRHKITQSTGADADHIDSLTWFDPVGRAIKSNGEMLTKTRFDRLGRATHQFTLSKDDDSGYANVYASGQTDVSGDTVVEENQTVYDDSGKSGLAVMKLSIARHWNESASTYGALDSNADADRLTATAANIRGRVQITSMWYDDLHRLTDTVMLGTGGIIGDGSSTTGTYARGSTVTSGQPSRSDTALRTTYSYGDDGAVKDVTDPLNLVSRTLYDAAGRKLTTIANYTGGATTNANRDNDVYTQFRYAHGLMTEMFVDINGNGSDTDSDDQITTYFYGTSTTASNSPSKIASGSLLRAIRYPDSTNAATSASYIDGSSDAQVTSYAYNTLGQKITQKDPAGNVLTYSYDKLGRETARAASVASGFDSDVLEIDTAYLARGLVSTVTQLGASSTVKDQLQYSYDDWGNLTKFEQDPDSVIGGSGRGAFSVQYSYAKAGSSSTRSTLRRSGMTMPAGNSLTYTYSTGMDADLSRVSAINNGTIDLAQYGYIGAASLVYSILPQAQAWTSAMESGVSYPYWDRFNRPIHSQWEKTYSNPAPTFYSADIAYDRDSNIVSVVDNIHKTDTPPNSGINSFDALYTMDGLNRLKEVQEGNKSGSSIGTQRRGEQWEDSLGNLKLSQTGNWDNYRLALSGITYTDEGRSFDKANKMTAAAGYSITYDLNGNPTDLGLYLNFGKFKYVYDAFNRLRMIKDNGGNLLQEYRYNGLGYRIAWHYDSGTVSGGLATEPDGAVDSGDSWFYFCYDESWRMLATYRDSDAYPKEQFYSHTAGLGGYGKSSYIDSVIMRDRDLTNSWVGAADGTLEERRYYCQNWRADVSAVLDASGGMVEWVKYSAYGVPFGIPAGDVTGDGSVTSTDSGRVTALNATGFGSSNYDVRADRNLDGTINGADASDVSGLVGTSLGRGYLSRSGTDNRKGYAGYEGSGGGVDNVWQVRRRTLSSLLGRWLQRDPLGYVDGTSLVMYDQDNPINTSDPTGASCATCLNTCAAAAVVIGTGVGIGSYAACLFALSWSGPFAPIICAAVIGAATGGFSAAQCPGICQSLGYCPPVATPGPVVPTPTPRPIVITPPDDGRPGDPPCADGITTGHGKPASWTPADPCGCQAVWSANQRYCQTCCAGAPPLPHGPTNCMDRCYLAADAAAQRCKASCLTPYPPEPTRMLPGQPERFN